MTIYFPSYAISSERGKKIAFKYKLIPNERVKGQLIWE